MFLCGNILTQTAHAQCYWERGADSDMNARACLFVRGLLAAIALGGMSLEMEVLELELGTRWDIPSAQLLSPPQ